jgi:phosphate-selective porin
MMLKWMVVTVLTASAAAGPHSSSDNQITEQNVLDSTSPALQDTTYKKEKEENKTFIHIGYGNKGWEFATSDGLFLLQLQWRMQFRYTHLSDIDPQADLEDQDNPARSFSLQRTRIKVNGYAYRNWVTYYFEYDFTNSNLLHYRFTLTKYRWLQLRLGQWKANFNTERVVSSGKQQFIDRSVINKFFPIDIQQGMMLLGHIFQDTQADAWYHAGVFNGTGFGNNNDDKLPMEYSRARFSALVLRCGIS